jgi:tRNA(His) guanylyltransferase
LYTQFGINYNHLPARFRKGSIVIRVDPNAVSSETAPEVESVETDKPKGKSKKRKPYEGTIGDLVVVHEDLIKEAFWAERPWLLS